MHTLAPAASLLLLSAPASAQEDPAIRDAAGIAEDVAKLAGEPLEQPARADVMDEAELRAFVQRRMAEDAEGLATLPHVDHLLKRLRLVPDDLDLVQLFQSTVSEEAAGLYDDEDGVLYLIRHGDAPPSQTDRLVLAHESGHLVDDRRWDLSAQRDALDGSLDHDVVLSVLWEGSATVQMARYGWGLEQAGLLDGESAHLMTHWLEPHTAEYDGLPPFLQDRMVAPYLLGQAVVESGPVGAEVLGAIVDPSRARLDAWMKAPPRTMAALLHPERAERPPAHAELAPLLAKLGWTMMHEDRVGELFTATALARPFPQGKAALTTAGWTNPAATGWVGDQLVVARRADDAAVDLWITAWQTPEDRAEFVAAWGLAHPEVAAVEVADRLAVVAWDLERGELRQIRRGLRRARWSGGGEGWSP